MTGDANSAIHEVYHTGLRNMHAVEMQAVETLQRQVERYENYPELTARLRQHVGESEEQARRLEAILQRHGTSPSAAKNLVTSLVGNVTAAIHAPAADEVLKNTFASYAFEHEEIAAYTSLIAMAERVGDTQSLSTLQQSLAEERSMAQWLGDQLAGITNRFLDLTASGKKAGV